jgi:hypothetical protein
LHNHPDDDDDISGDIGAVGDDSEADEKEEQEAGGGGGGGDDDDEDRDLVWDDDQKLASVQKDDDFVTAEDAKSIFEDLSKDGDVKPFADLDDKVMSTVMALPSVRRRTFLFSATLTLAGEDRLKGAFRKKKLPKNITDMDKLLQKLDISRGKSDVVDVTNRAKMVSEERLDQAKIECVTDENYYFLSLYPGRTIVFVNAVSALRRRSGILTTLRVQAYPLHSEMEQR